MQSDGELYESYLAGDTSACDALMLRYGDAVTAYLNGFLHDFGDSEDLMIEVFARIMVRKPKIREGNFRAYLFGAARHEAARKHRLKTRLSEFSLEDAPPPAVDSSETEYLKRERIEALRRCLDRLEPRYREPLWLVYAMGLSYEQTAKVLGCSAKKIDNLLTAGKKLLRRELEGEGAGYAIG